MMTDKDLTDDVLDEIIAGAKTSMEQYLALSLKAERTANRQQNSQQNIPEIIPVTLFKPVADLYEMQFDDGRTCAFHTDGAKAVQWLLACDGNKVQEYVKLVRYQEALSGNSPVIPECSCHACRPVTFADSRFVVCPDCGNKRCPHANDHRNACTGSNEPGQEGSAYPAAPQQEAKP